MEDSSELKDNITFYKYIECEHNSIVLRSILLERFLCSSTLPSIKYHESILRIPPII